MRNIQEQESLLDLIKKKYLKEKYLSTQDLADKAKLKQLKSQKVSDILMVEDIFIDIILNRITKFGIQSLSPIEVADFKRIILERTDQLNQMK